MTVEARDDARLGGDNIMNAATIERIPRDELPEQFAPAPVYDL